MSRSYYHTPIMGVTGHANCKAWRTQENRKYRAYVKNLMRHERYDDISAFRGRFGNEWDSPRDGKMWFGNMKYRKCPYMWLFCGVYQVYCKDDRHLCSKYYYKFMRK